MRLCHQGGEDLDTASMHKMADGKCFKINFPEIFFPKKITLDLIYYC